MMQYYSEVKGYEPSSLQKTWKKLKCLLPSETSQAKKSAYCMILLYDILEKAVVQTAEKINGGQGLGGPRYKQAEHRVGIE